MNNAENTCHDYAQLFPMLQGEQLDALRSDIAANGVREPIVFIDGSILDGRNRYACAMELGLDYPRREFGSESGDGTDPLAFVISHNLTRRHLTESQRAHVAARLANMKRGRPEDNSANLRNKDAAKMLNVSTRSVESARKVLNSAPDLGPLVEDGSLPVSLAAKAAGLQESERAEIIAAPHDERNAKAKAFVQHNTGNNEWYTPPQFLDAARSVLGDFDLDPASSEVANANVKAKTFYSEDDSGLERDWSGRIWMNPPYAANLVGKVCTKFAETMEAGGASGIVLVNNASETVWWQTLAGVSSAICFPKSRIRFLNPEGEAGAPLQGQTIFYSGSDPDAFKREFQAFGFVVFCNE